MSRQQPCGRAEAVNRLRVARTYLEMAQLAAAAPGAEAVTVAAGNVVLAAIAAADAICCSRLGRRHRGQRHDDAAALLEEVEPGGRRLAADLRRILSEKDAAHYGLDMLSRARWSTLERCATRLVDAAAAFVTRG
jgi:hypothetical protein